MYDATQQQLDAMQADIRKLTEDVQSFRSQTIDPNTKLNNNLDTKSKDIIAQVVSSRLIDLFWDSLFYYNTWFESPTGFTIINSATISGGGCAVTSPGSGVASSSISAANTSFAGEFSFTKDSRWRATAQFTRTATQDIRIGVGDVKGGVPINGYGFRVLNSTLQGITGNGSAGSVLNILTIAANTDYDLQAKMYAGNRVDFIVDGVPRGSISTTLPSTAGTVIWSIEATESSAQTKQIFIGSFEYIQTP